MNISGRNIVMVVRVEVIIVMFILWVLVMVVLRMFRLCLCVLVMFFSIMMELFIIRFVVSVRLLSDMMFRFRFNWFMKKNVVMIDIGNDRLIMNVF